MELEYYDLEDAVRHIRLIGRMDLEGTGEIDLKFTSLAAVTRAFVVVDLTRVDFLSSIGLGTLVRTAKALHSREGKMVLFGPQAHVARVLQATRIDEILPVFTDFDAARRAVRPSGP